MVIREIDDDHDDTGQEEDATGSDYQDDDEVMWPVRRFRRSCRRGQR